MKANLEELASGRLGRLLFKYSWPALVAMTLNALYAVVDRMFIGQGCGVDAMAGLQLAMPAMMILASFGPLIGVGHSSLLSIRLGMNDRVACEKILGETVALKILLYVILVPFLYWQLDTVLAWCGADRVTPGAFHAAKHYLQIVLISQLFSHLAFGLSALQRSEGGAIKSMVSMVVGFGANMILDPILIFGLHFSLFTFHFSLPAMGIAGAAWATDIAMFASALTAFLFYWTGSTVIKLRLRRVWIYPEFLFRSLSIGLAPFLQQVLSSVIIASLQYAFAKWLADPVSRTNEIASLGVFSSALILTFLPVLGCQQGLQPIYGYNWGARNFKRVLAALKLGFAVTTVLTCLAWAIQVIPPLPEWVARIFVSADQPELIRLAAKDLQLSNCMIWCISINIVATTYYQSIGKPAVAILLSLLRQGVVLLPIVWLLPYFLEDKTFAIWLSMPVSDVVCNVVTILPLVLQFRFLTRIRERKDFIPQTRSPYEKATV